MRINAWWTWHVSSLSLFPLLVLSSAGWRSARQVRLCGSGNLVQRELNREIRYRLTRPQLASVYVRILRQYITRYGSSIYDKITLFFAKTGTFWYYTES